MKKVALFLVLLTCTLFCAANQVSQMQQPFIKKYENQKRIISPEKAQLNKEPEPDINNSFASLYNGKDLSNWTVRGGYSTFKALPDRVKKVLQVRTCPLFATTTATSFLLPS